MRHYFSQPDLSSLFLVLELLSCVSILHSHRSRNASVLCAVLQKPPTHPQLHSVAVILVFHCFPE